MTKYSDPDISIHFIKYLFFCNYDQCTCLRVLHKPGDLFKSSTIRKCFSNAYEGHFACS